MLARFPSPPDIGEVTVAERNCTLLSEAVDSGDESRTTSFQSAGKVKVSDSEIGNSPLHYEYVKRVLVRQ